jgi:hypothetical protein
MNTHTLEHIDYQKAVTDAGWVIKTYQNGVQKWMNPNADDGSRYPVDNPRSLRYIYEDYIRVK